MKRFSIKQLVIVFIIGFVLLTGAQCLTMDSSNFGKGIHEKMIQEHMIDGDFSEEQMQEYLENTGSQREFGSRKHR